MFNHLGPKIGHSVKQAAEVSVMKDHFFRRDIFFRQNHQDKSNELLIDSHKVHDAV